MIIESSLLYIALYKTTSDEGCLIKQPKHWACLNENAASIRFYHKLITGTFCCIWENDIVGLSCDSVKTWAVQGLSAFLQTWLEAGLVTRLLSFTRVKFWLDVVKRYCPAVCGARIWYSPLWLAERITNDLASADFNLYSVFKVFKVCQQKVTRHQEKLWGVLSVKS